MKRLATICAVVITLFIVIEPAIGNLLITDISGDRVIEVDSSGTIVWEMNGLDNPADAERLSNGNTLIACHYGGRIIEVDSSGTIVWEMNGLHRPADVERLDNGNTLIADYGSFFLGDRVIEVDSSGTIVWQSTGWYFPIDVERLDNGNTLITENGPGYDSVIEIDSSGTIVWQTTGQYYDFSDAERLDNGNTLIAAERENGRVMEVDSLGTIVWEKTGLALPFDAERLDNGNTLIVESENGRVIEVDSSGTIVWELTGLNYPVDVEVVGPVSPYYVEIDIKPGSYPNSINLGNEGVIPVAILSSAEFDATTVDPATVELAGAGVELRGKSDKAMAHREDVNKDGRIDLVVQITTQNLDPGAFQDGYATLTGRTYSGLFIEGADEITIVPK